MKKLPAIMTGSLKIDPIFCLQELLNDPDGSEEQNRLGKSLTCINDSDYGNDKHEDAPEPSDEGDDSDESEKCDNETLIGIESEIIGTLTVYISSEVSKDNSDESAHNRYDSENLVTRINRCIKRS